MKKIILCLFILFICSIEAPVFSAIQIDTVLIDNPEQGGVDYIFNIGRTEVTVEQYVVFLNSVAVDDLNGLYNPDMAGPYGGIIRNGSLGSYSYNAKIGWEKKPVTFVPWVNAARFTNWLHNGQPSGLQSPSTTESGAYDLSVPDPIDNVSRSSNALWFIPSDAEWKKAAYFDPTKGGVVGGGFWQWPTMSDDAPTGEVASIEGPSVGNNSANYDLAVGSLISVGCYPNSLSFYGTLDQVGNAWELVEDIYATGERTLRGDSYSGSYGGGHIGHSVSTGDHTLTGDHDTGFRVATTIRDTIDVYLDKIGGTSVELIKIPNGRPIYAFLVSGYHQNEQFDTFHFYNFAKRVLEMGGYVHYSWWNNLLAPYMERPLHNPASEPGNFPSGDWLGFVPILDLVVDKATPSEDFQFQLDLRHMIESIRGSNPNAVIVLVGHSMGGDAVARFGANTTLDIDILAPIDPVGNRTCTPLTPGSMIWECPGFLMQMTRYRAIHEDVFLLPGRRIFGSNVKYLYHRWQQEFAPPFDSGFPLPGFLLNCPYDGAEPDYLFDLPGRPRACGIGQGSTNVQSKIPTSIFSGCELDSRWWICPDASGGFDGHGEIIGWRGALHAYKESALMAEGNWPSRYGTDNNSVNRVNYMKKWEAYPNYLEVNSYAPTNPHRCKVSGDLRTILATIMDQAPPVNQPPVADANGPYESECEGTTTNVSLDGSGSSDPEGTDLTYFWATNCPGGYFDDPFSATPELTVDTSNGCAVDCIVELTVTDVLGKKDIATAAVTIGDTVSPEISCPADTTIECDESTEPSDTGFATATDECDLNPAVTFSDVTIPGECPQEFTIERTWTATDYCENTSSCVQNIEVVDSTPPVISSVSASPKILWPPNHKMRLVTVEAVAVDNCDPEPVCKIISVKSNEAPRRKRIVYKNHNKQTNRKYDGNTASDWEIIGDLKVKLRAERAGSGNGRKYTITVKCTDDCDNIVTEDTTVKVPHDKGKKKGKWKNKKKDKWKNKKK